MRIVYLNICNVCNMYVCLIYISEMERYIIYDFLCVIVEDMSVLHIIK